MESACLMGGKHISPNKDGPLWIFTACQTPTRMRRKTGWFSDYDVCQTILIRYIPNVLHDVPDIFRLQAII